MTPLGLLGPLNQDWLKENKVIGCPHPHIPSGKLGVVSNVKNIVKCGSPSTYLSRTSRISRRCGYFLIETKFTGHYKVSTF